MKGFGLLFRLSRPHFLVGAAVIYALGAGIARFLGAYIDWGVYLLGQAWVTTIQLSTHFFNEYYDAPYDKENPNRTPFSGGSGVLRTNDEDTDKDKLPREWALWLGVSCLAIVASLAVLLIRQSGQNGIIIVLMLLIFLGSFFYSTPPIQLASSGYGELTTSFLVVNLVPALAFILQYDEFHRLLAMVTFPLTPLHLAMMITFELPDYAIDLKYNKKTLLIRLGWQQGMLIHNLMVLMAFFILGLAAFFGLPLSIALPGFLTLPLGLFQIWMMNRIADGARPNWPSLTFTAAALLGLTAYLLAFSLWTR